MATGLLSIKLRCASWQQLATIYKRDLSRGTMFLKASTPPPVGTPVQIDLTLPSATVIVLTGAVAQHVTDPQRGQGVELKLRPLPAGSVWLIESALASESKRKNTAPAGGRSASTSGSFPAQQSGTFAAVSAAPTSTTAASSGEFPALGDSEDLVAAEQDLVKALLAEVESLKKLNPFLVLGVGYESNDTDVRAAFGELTKRYHPDLFARYESTQLRQVAAEIFILLRDAYRRLGDETGRAQALAALGRSAAPRAVPLRGATSPVPPPPTRAHTSPIATVPRAPEASPPRRAPSDPTPGTDPDRAPGEPPRPLTDHAATVRPGEAPAIHPATVRPGEAPAIQPATVRPGEAPPIQPATVRPGEAPPIAVPTVLPPFRIPAVVRAPDAELSRAGQIPMVPAVPPPAGRPTAQAIARASSQSIKWPSEPPPPSTSTAHPPPEIDRKPVLSSPPPVLTESGDGDAIEEMLDAGKLDDALVAYKVLAKKYPSDRTFRAGIELCEGMRAMAQRDRLEAAQRFETALETDPSNERAARELAEMRRQATNERKGLLTRLMGKDSK